MSISHTRMTCTRIFEAIPRDDRGFHELAIVHAFRGLDPADVEVVDGFLHLFEVRVAVDDRVYGFVLEPRDWGFQARAYWRVPTTAGFTRAAALNLAHDRRSAP